MKDLHPAEYLHPTGNVFAIIGKVQSALREAGQPERAAAFRERAFKANSYDAVLQLCLEFVEVE